MTAFDQNSDAARICLVRYHDGTAKPNWGGRATSLALGRVISNTPGASLESVVNGSVVTRRFPSPTAADWRRRISRGATRRIPGVLRFGRAQQPEFGPRHFAGAAAEAAVRLERLHDVRKAFEAADEVWVNGEGDMILYRRPSLYRMLVLMHMADLMGKRVRMVNAILSRPSYNAADESVISAVDVALRVCVSVAYRDPESLRLHRELFDTPASMVPDALFAWANPNRYASPDWFGPQGESLAPELQTTLAKGTPYAVISGSSAISFQSDRDRAAKNLASTADALRKRGLEPIIVATCEGDRWMLEAAKNSFAVRPTVPLASGMHLLANAACFLSGRYHPSILAADCGTPAVFMRSNSHKTRSLQELLGQQPSEFPFFSEKDFDVDAVSEATLHAVDQSRPDLLATSIGLANQVTYT